jgi:AAA+ superfamily predicted ATPase
VTARGGRGLPTIMRPPAKAIRWFEPKDVSRDMVLYGAQGARLEQLVEEFAAVPDFLHAEIDAPTRMLFSGPSGTGKTMAARWVGWRLGVPIAYVSIAATIGMYVGESGKNLAEAFEAASSIDAILFLDEIDGISVDRSKDNSNHDDRTTTTLLQEMDLLKPQQLVIAATNVAKALDPAVRRRLHEEVLFEPPPLEIRKSMIDKWLRKAKVDETLREELARDSAGVAGAELRELAMQLGRQVILDRRKGAPKDGLFAKPGKTSP